jgi:PAS domain S-box-containing protein
LGFLRLGKSKKGYLTVVKKNTQQELDKLVEKFLKEDWSEKALGALEADYKEIFNIFPDPLLILDPETGAIVDTNDKACKLLKYTHRDLITTSFGSLSCGEPPHTEVEALRWIRKGFFEGPQTFEWVAKDRENKLLWVQIDIQRFVLKGKDRILAAIQNIIKRKRTVEVMLESDKKFQSIFVHMVAACCFYEIVYENGQPVDYRILDVNPSFERITGISKSAAVGALGSKLYGTGEAPFFDVYSRVAETGRPASFEAYFAPIGKHLHVMASCPEKGKFFTVFTDITERKKAEETLQQSEEEKTILNQIANIFLTTTDEKMYQRVLAVVLPMMGSKYGIFDFIGDKGELIMHNLTGDVWNECQVPNKSHFFPSDAWGDSIWGRAIREKKSFYLGGPFRTPEGHIHIDCFLTVPIVFGQQTIGLISVANKEGGYREEDQELLERISNNISPILNARLQRDRLEQERKKSENEIKEREEELTAIYDNAPLIMLLVDDNWTIHKTNVFTAQFVGTTIANMVNRRCGEALHCAHACDISEGCGFGPSCKECAVRLTILNTIETGISHREEEVKMSFPDMGNQREATFLISTKKLLIREQPLALVSMQDITERKQMEEGLKKGQEQLYQAQKMKSLETLVAGVAHEINNPINSINLNARLLENIWEDFMPVLKNYAANKPLKKYEGLPYDFIKENLGQILKDINLAANRIIKIVTDLKNFAHPSDITDKKPINLNNAVKNALRLIQSTVKESGVHLALSLENNLPLFDGNYPSMEQIILNLTLNALQAIYHSHGKIEIATGFDKQKEELFITVSDNGHGIDPAIADRIFDPFVTNRQAEGGTGLGLSITYNLVNAHNGKITFETAKGKGTTFKISLPLSPNKKLSKILIVVDDKKIRDLLKNLFDFGTKRHFQVQEAANGTEACIKLGTFRPDLLILDLLMPEMDGLEVCRVIKKQPELANMKVIVLTGFPEHPKAEQVAVIGFTNICVKPFKPEELMRLIDRLLKVNDNVMMARNSAS